MAAASFAYFPLTFGLPQTGSRIIKDTGEKVRELQKSGKLPPGLAEQYDLQLDALRDQATPDCQLISGRGLTTDDLRMFSTLWIQLLLTVTLAGTAEGKTYLRMVWLANHTFSRGTIVSQKLFLPFSKPKKLHTFSML